METVEATTTTTTMESTPKGVKEETRVEREYNPDVQTHCGCPECLEYEEDIAHELATLRQRLSALESGGPTSSAPSASETKPSSEEASNSPSEKPKGETVITTTEEIKPKKQEKRYAGWLA